MTKKNWLLIAIMVALAALYVVYFTDWFKPRKIIISHTALRAMTQPAGALPLLIFGFNGSFRLTELKVVPLAEWQTNQHVLPVWHLVSDSNSVPIKLIHYGAGIRGMKPAVEGKRAEPLDPDTVYRLFVTAGNIKAQHDFKLYGQIGDASAAGK
jgi:hypothetical protein